MNDRQIIDEFVAESSDHLANIESQLLAIETGGQAVDAELVNTVFRAVHSIKGAAGFFQFTHIEQLSHALENVLSLIRNRQIAPDAASTNVLLTASDTLRAMIEDVDHSNDVDVSQHLAALEAVAAMSSLSAPEPETPTTAQDMEQTLDLAEEFVAQAADQPPTMPLCQFMSPTTETVPPDGASLSHPSADGTPSTQSASTTDTNIRVPVRVLDHLMNLAGELVLSRNQLLQTVTAHDRGNLDSISARLNQVTSEIQEAVMQTRLQAVETVFSKFPRLVRDLTNTLGKQCDLMVEGEDVELDKSIIEAIGDPLTHLIRNAVDHGIEKSDVRVAAGKPSKGRILLKAFHQAGKVNLAVIDDGAGIDPARVKEKAVSHGLISAEHAREMSDREALRLIFRPGFSTAEKLTNLSGRGVGMDVVKTNVERLGGTVDIDSQLALGTTINITLPLTLAIIPSLIVRSNNIRFALPQASISELVRVRAEEAAEKLQHIKSAEVLRLRGDLLPLVRLSAVLGENQPEASKSSKNVNVIVVESNLLRYGLVVDTLHDSEEIVVKPLGQHIKNCRCFAGATILGDGQVALILDISGLAAQVNLAMHAELGGQQASESATQTSEDTQDMLLFTNDPTEQFAVPMGIVSRLERIRADQIDHVGGQEVLQYRGGSLPLLSLEHLVKALPRPEQSRLYVIVFRVGKREIGLVAPQLTDIRRISTDLDVSTFREPGVIGSLVLDGHATRMLDLVEMTRTARPDWIDGIAAPSAPAHTTDNINHDQDRDNENEADYVPTILLAEDSSFFRKQLTGFLQADGYNVLACEDGQVAWDVLCHPGHPCDLIVTDLEMPNLNGFDLAWKVRNTPSLSHLPIIAVTSLASDEDVERGKQVGITEYHIKLDRERLMATVAEYLYAVKK